MPESGKEKWQPYVEEFAGFKVGQAIEWLDDRVKSQFLRPAFGYGVGPFSILRISITPGAKVESKKFYETVKLEIKTPKGSIFLSADYFKQVI